MKRLSVIIPGSNTRQDDWNRCLRSVVAVCGADDEVICVDDGSSQRPKLDVGDSRVRAVFKERREGPGAARNAGLEIAQGKYVTFIDSDDEVLGEAIEHCIERLEQSEADIALYGAETVWPDDGLMKVDVPTGLTDGEVTPAVLRSMYERNLSNCVWGKVYRRSFLETHGIRFDTTAITGEDLIFNLLCLAKRPKWCFVPEVGYRYYRTHSTLLSKYKPSLIDGFRAVNAAWDEYEKVFPLAADTLQGVGRYDENVLDALEWKNIWMPASPYTLKGCWKWLKEHPQCGGRLAVLKMLVYVVLRRWFYIRPIRRWHLKRAFPSVVDV